MSFTAQPDVHWRDDGRLELDCDLIYWSADAKRYLIPAGFVTDLASVPRFIPGIVRLIFRGNLLTARAAILHDWLYYTKMMSRREADDLFYEALRSTGEGLLGAWTMWSAVRISGWWAWMNKR